MTLPFSEFSTRPFDDSIRREPCAIHPCPDCDTSRWKLGGISPKTYSPEKPEGVVVGLPFTDPGPEVTLSMTVLCDGHSAELPRDGDVWLENHELWRPD